MGRAPSPLGGEAPRTARTGAGGSRGDRSGREKRWAPPHTSVIGLPERNL